MSERITITGMKVNDAYCIDVMTNIVESGGSNFWADFQNIQRNSEGDITRMEVSESEQDTAVKPGWHVVNWDDVRRAIELIMTKNLVNTANMNAITGDDNDADSCDCILQVMIFGELIYG